MINADTVAHYLTPADGFAEIADTYDARMASNAMLEQENAAVLAALPRIGPSQRFADIACGTGRYVVQVARLSRAELIGVDLAPAMLATAARKARRAEIAARWERGDLCSERLPIEDGSVDAAVCAFALSFVPDVRPAFAAMARVLAPGGTLVLSDYHPFGLCAARAASRARFARDRAPYLRFTSANGTECRIPHAIHTIADLFNGARAAGLALDLLDEPIVDHDLAATYGSSLRDRIGTPLALVMRFIRSKPETKTPRP